MSEDIKGFSIYEKIGIGIPNPGVVRKFPITDEMWAKVCKRAEKAGMDPIAFFYNVFDEHMDSR